MGREFVQEFYFYTFCILAVLKNIGILKGMFFEGRVEIRAEDGIGQNRGGRERV